MQFCLALFVKLVGFLTSSSTTRLFSPSHSLCISRSHYTDTDPTSKEQESNPRPPDQDSRALPTKLHPPPPPPPQPKRKKVSLNTSQSENITSGVLRKPHLFDFIFRSLAHFGLNSVNFFISQICAPFTTSC